MPHMAMYALLALIFTFVWLKNKYTHWRRRGVNGPTPWPFIGNVGGIMLNKESVHEFSRRLYQDYPHEQLVGFYEGLTPALLIRDPELIKYILVKDYESFNTRGLRSRSPKYDDNLFLAEGETWKMLRQKFSPSFSSSKLKKMMPLIDTCMEKFIEHVDQLVESKNIEQDARDLCRLFALDSNGRCCFGISMEVYNSECENKNVLFAISEEIMNSSVLDSLTKIILIMLPGIARLLIQWFDKQQSLEKLTRTFNNLIEQIKKEKKGKLNRGGDLMDVIIDLKTAGNKENGNETVVMDDQMLALQAMTFFVAGSEPTTLFLSYLLFEMASHQDIQQRLFDEICKTAAKYNGKVTHNSVKDMPYLNMILDEVFRNYAITLTRKCIQTYRFPERDLTIEKGTNIIIPVHGLHRDPKYFKDPEIFNPERFLPENHTDILPSVYFPFGGGPRHCIGSQLGRMQCLVGAAGLLLKYRILATDRTPRGRLTMDPRHLTPRSLERLWIGIEKR